MPYSSSEEEEYSDEGGFGCNMGDFVDGDLSDEDAEDVSSRPAPRRAMTAGASASETAARSTDSAPSASNTVVIQSLSGEKRVPVSASAAATAAMPERKDISTVTVFYTLKATPEELASGKAPRLELSEDVHGVFDNASSGAARSKNHVLYDAQLTHVRNEFPFDMGMNIDCSTCSSLSPEGSIVVPSYEGKPIRANVMIQANENSNYAAASKDGAPVIIHGNGKAFDQKAFARQYPEFNLGNLRSSLQQITDPEHGTMRTMIPYTHPATKYYNHILESQGLPRISESDFTGGMRMFPADPEDTDKVLSRIEDELKKGTGDLYKIGFDVTRVHGSVSAGASAPAFNDHTEMSYKFASAATAAATVQQKKMLVIGVRYKFRHS